MLRSFAAATSTAPCVCSSRERASERSRIAAAWASASAVIREFVLGPGRQQLQLDRFERQALERRESLAGRDHVAGADVNDRHSAADASCGEGMPIPGGNEPGVGHDPGVDRVARHVGSLDHQGAMGRGAEREGAPLRVDQDALGGQRLVSLVGPRTRRRPHETHGRQQPDGEMPNA
jgi:hypothetical protein